LFKIERFKNQPAKSGKTNKKTEKPKKKREDRTVQTSVKQKTTKHSPIIYAALSSE
jgi:hypothetical protein